MHVMFLLKAVLRRDDKLRRIREPLVLGTVGTCTKIEGQEVPATKSSVTRLTEAADATLNHRHSRRFQPVVNVEGI